MPIRCRTRVAIRPALLLAVALFSTSSELLAQHVPPASTSHSPLVPLTTQWPSRTGIAVMAPGQVNAMSVEATSDGWVVVTPLAHWAEARDDGPTMRLYAAPEEVQAWTTAARRLPTRAPDSTEAVEGIRLPPLGRGRIHLAPRAREWRENILLELITCDGVGSGITMSPTDFERFTGVLERATEVARRAPARSSPTLHRPYYQSEVSCAARLETASALPRFPSSMPRAARRYTEAGVQFVVDTSGFVEAGSLTMLRGASAAIERATRAIVRGWHYRPAEWSGLPVRQIVTAVVAFDPADAATRRDPARVAASRSDRPVDPALHGFPPRPPTFVSSDGGWVRVGMGHWRPDGVFDGFQEWFHPDSVDEWVARAGALIAADSAHPRYPPPPRDAGPMPVAPTRPGNRLMVQYQNGWSSDTERLKLVFFITGCGGGSVVPSTEIDRRLLSRLLAASRAARRHRHTEPSLDRAYMRGEVACPSYLAPTSARQRDLPGVWRHPRAPYPAALANDNVRAEVLTSFELDTLGAPIAGTLEVAPGSDPRAANALRKTIDHIRFHPAARAGTKVRTRVIRSWLFEPPSVCANENDGIDCARVYDRNP